MKEKEAQERMDDGELVRPLWGRLVNFAWHLLRDSHAAEDMAQETLVRFVEKRDTIRPGSEAAWLFSTCRLLCRNRRRKLLPYPLREEDAVLVDGAGRSAARLDLARALETLSEESRELFLLRVLGDFTVPELASLLEIPEGTVKSRLFHATLKLRPRLAGYGKGENCGL